MSYYRINGDNIEINTRELSRSCRVFIASPIYTTANPHYVSSLTATIALLGNNAIRSKCHWLTGIGEVALARNIIAAEFLLSDCTHLFTPDDDMSWQPDDVLRFLAYDLPVVSGRYVKKAIGAGFNDKLGDESKILTDGRPYLTRAERIPGGFSVVKREVFEVLHAEFPHFKFSINDERLDPHMFATYQHGRDGGFWRGEDYHFSDLCRHVGIPIWVDRLAVVTHWGHHGFTGDPQAC